MAGHGSAPPPDRGEHPSRKVARQQSPPTYSPETQRAMRSHPSNLPHTGYENPDRASHPNRQVGR